LGAQSSNWRNTKKKESEKGARKSNKRKKIPIEKSKEEQQTSICKKDRKEHSRKRAGLSSTYHEKGQLLAKTLHFCPLLVCRERTYPRRALVLQSL